MRAADVDIINADTDRTPYDTGTFASTGTVVAGKAVMITAEAMKADILDFACRHTGVVIDQCRLDNDAVVCGNKRITLKELHGWGCASAALRLSVPFRPRSLRLEAQDAALSRLKHGFESRRERHQNIQ